VAALAADLQDVHTIMSRNIAEVLGQGEKLDSEYRIAGGSAARLATSYIPQLRQQAAAAHVCVGHACVYIVPYTPVLWLPLKAATAMLFS
jgi:hypothetical protein